MELGEEVEAASVAHGRRKEDTQLFIGNKFPVVQMCQKLAKSSLDVRRRVTGEGSVEPAVAKLLEGFSSVLCSREDGPLSSFV